jgi:hypothetical protein
MSQFFDLRHRAAASAKTKAGTGEETSGAPCKRAGLTGFLRLSGQVLHEASAHYGSDSKHWLFDLI